MEISVASLAGGADGTKSFFPYNTLFLIVVFCSNVSLSAVDITLISLYLKTISDLYLHSGCTSPASKH